MHPTVQKTKKYINKKWDLLRDPFCTKWFVDTGIGPSYAVIGDMRSGTTWLSELINYNDQFRYIFEPLRFDQLNTPNRELYSDIYLRSDGQDEYLKGHLDAVFSGKWRNLKSDSFNQKIWSSKRLVKFVRMNLCLKWFSLNFPNIPTVFIVRHPFSVALSRDGRGMDWFPFNRKNMLQQPDLLEGPLRHFQDLLYDQELSKFEHHVLLWSIRHLVPFSQCSGDEVLLLYYEDLVCDYITSIRRVFLHYGLVCDEQQLLRIKDRWSGTTVSKNVLMDIDLVCRRFGSAAVDKGLAVLDRLGLLSVYDETPYPKHKHPFRLFGEK